MINKKTNTVRCDQCGNEATLDSENKPKWSSRRHLDKLIPATKHYCPTCTNINGFYANGVTLFT